MSLESFMRYHGDAVRVREDALRMLNRISEEQARTEEMLEYDIEQTFQFKFPETECVIRMLAGEWGIYGVGAAYLADEDVGDERIGAESPVTAPALLLDPLWLVRDLDRLDARAPQLWAWQAEWARLRIEELLGHTPLDGFVFQTSARPRPFAVAPGGKTEFTDTDGIFTGTAGDPILGTLGPRATLNQQDGFLTAGHVAPLDVNADPSQAWIDVTDDAGGSNVGTIQVVRHVAAYGSTTGRGVQGDVDAAFVTFDDDVDLATGSGAAGEAAADSVVSKTGAKTGRTEGKVASYLVWAGGKNGVWRDCYGIVLGRQQQHFKSFADTGDSGAAVALDGGTVVGMVVGGAVRLPGCSQSVTYAQDIEVIATELGCTVVI